MLLPNVAAEMYPIRYRGNNLTVQKTNGYNKIEEVLLSLQHSNLNHINFNRNKWKKREFIPSVTVLPRGARI